MDGNLISSSLVLVLREFLGQAWMKADKKSRAEHIIEMTKRFNDGSRLVSSEIISRYVGRVRELGNGARVLLIYDSRRSNMAARVAAIEKWTAVADICRCLHNFNGVLQICAAFTNAAVYRLKKTWDKVPKTVSASFSPASSGFLLTRHFIPWTVHVPTCRSSKRSQSSRQSFAPMVDSGRCVRYCTAATRPASHTWACT